MQPVIGVIGTAIDGDFELTLFEPLFEFAGGGIDHLKIEIGMVAPEAVNQNKKG